MFICLTYDSLFLSFPAFLPIFPIKDVSQLAKSVINGENHCLTPVTSIYAYLFAKSEEESLRIIGKDIQTNNLNHDQIWYNFLNGNINQNLSILIDENVVDILSVGKKFISEDRFLETINAMMVRKDFYCKKKK